MEGNKYTKDKLKELFYEQRIKGDFNISDDQYDVFCNAIAIYLPGDIIDLIFKEIHFVVQVLNPAFYLSLESQDLKNKKGIIFLSPAVFNDSANPLNPYFAILHEIAHHVRGHIDVSSSEDRKVFEKEANDLAYSWMGFTKDGFK